MTLGRILAAVVLFVGVAAGPRHSHAAEVSLTFYDRDKGEGVVEIHGEIADGDTRRYLAISSALLKRRAHIALVLLNSNGGDEVEAETLSLYGIGYEQPIVMVASRSTCASACVLLLMASERRVVALGGRVGVHSITEARAGETLSAMGRTTDMARTLADRGMAADVIGHLVSTPPNSVYWLTTDELQRSGIKVGPRF